MLANQANFASFRSYVQTELNNPHVHSQERRTRSQHTFLYFNSFFSYADLRVALAWSMHLASVRPLSHFTARSWKSAKTQTMIPLGRSAPMLTLRYSYGTPSHSRGCLHCTLRSESQCISVYWACATVGGTSSFHYSMSALIQNSLSQPATCGSPGIENSELLSGLMNVVRKFDRSFAFLIFFIIGATQTHTYRLTMDFADLKATIVRYKKGISRSSRH